MNQKEMTKEELQSLIDEILEDISICTAGTITKLMRLTRYLSEKKLVEPICSGVLFQLEVPKETYILHRFCDAEGNSIHPSDAGDWEDRGNGSWFFRFKPPTLPKEKL